MAKKRRADPEEAKPIKLEVPMPADGIGSLDYWANEMDASRRKRDKDIKDWKRNLDRAYRSTKDRFLGLAQQETIIVPTDFYNVEQKKAQLFFQTPAVQVTPERPEVDGAAPPLQHILNYQLGAKGANVKRTASECLTDVLCPSGIGASEIGYECARVTKKIPTGRMIDVFNPAGFMEKALATDPETGEPEEEEITETIWDRYYWERFSPAKLLLPVSLTTTQFDKGPWIAREFDLDHEQMESTYGVGRGELGDYSENSTLAPDRDKEFMRQTGRGVNIYYRAWIFDKDAPPELVRRLVLTCGKRKDYIAAIHENCKYQRFDPDGRLTMGMRGFPIHPMTIRVVSDTAIPPSDCTIARPLADELSIGRSQMLKQRARNIPTIGFNKKAIPQEVLQKLERGDWQAMIGFDMPITEGDFKQLAQAHFPPENFGFNTIINQDLDKTWGFANNQNGIGATGGQTATESQIIENNKDIRISADRVEVLQWFSEGVEKFASLLPLYATNEWLAEVEGPDGAMKLQTWDKNAVQGRYAFTIRPDSSVRINAAEDRELQLRFNNLTANNPYINQLENAKALARKFNMDPSKIVQTPPPAPPEKPKLSVSIKGDDLNPFAPQYANVLILLSETGVKGLAPAAPIQPEQVITAAAPARPVDQHEDDLTGMRSGPRVQ